MAVTKMVRRWRDRMVVTGDGEYCDRLQTLSDGSVRRNFNPYLDIPWDSPQFRVIPDDPRWVLAKSDPLGASAWYRAQPLEKQIAIGIWRQTNIAKAGQQFESMLIRGLLEYTFWVPNGSPEYRYCLHEAIEEGNHTLMFQEMVNHTGVDVPGLPRWVKWINWVFPLFASPMPAFFFMMVLCGEEPIDHLQKEILREGNSIHPIMERVMAIHVAEEARHISFAHEFLRRRIPEMRPLNRFVLSLFYPLGFRVAASLIAKPPGAFWREFDIPKSVKKQIFWRAPESRTMLREIYGDVRMLAEDTGLMNPIATVLWRMFRIDGPASRFRSEPVRHAAVPVA
ncbi:diiron oxygenase [Mycolicibacterium sp. CBMA 226]|uniref:AurF N-oxygenase family protein n=1 Tax=Mycolicibacterium sp. CBMA 226 TaxID=2606611 RepID=UPI0012DD4073|nr:diiron oxygenase [Mycolicibacterium sp. CBMA 226]MUL77954.1 diiron oxygenase [Mycolicibacterium sp. CBMA 226]